MSHHGTGNYTLNVFPSALFSNNWPLFVGARYTPDYYLILTLKMGEIQNMFQTYTPIKIYI